MRRMAWKMTDEVENREKGARGKDIRMKRDGEFVNCTIKTM